MRATLLVAVALLAAGCLGAPNEAPTGQGPPVTSPPPTDGVADVVAPEDEAPLVGELLDAKLVFSSGYKLLPMLPGAPPAPEGTEPEKIDPAGLYLSAAGQPIDWSPWATDPHVSAVEIVGDVIVRVKYVADAAAVETTPRAADFPPMGGWIGTGESRNIFYLVNAAPAQLEAGKVYDVSVTIPMPDGGFLVKAGETFSPHVWLAYKVADNSPVKYVVGGEDPATVSYRARTLTLPPTTAVEILSETGEFPPHPGFTTEGNPGAVSFPLEIPPGAVYVTLECGGESKGGQYDVDCDFTRGGTPFLGGHGPGAPERVTLGPGNLAAGTSGLGVSAASSGATGGTFTLKVTAHVGAS